MNERSKAFGLGLFVLICAALIMWLVLFLRPSVGDGDKILKIRFSNIEKVTVGTRVTFAGKPIGEVIAICEIHDAREQPTDSAGNIYFYELVVRVDSHVKVYTYDDIIFSTAGLLGEKTIAIVPKQAPKGSPPPQELKDGVLYAKSTDRIEEAVTKLIEVSDVLEQTMCEVLCFFKENGKDFNVTLTSLNSCTSEVQRFFAEANKHHLAEHFSGALGQAEIVFGQAVDSHLVSNLGAIAGQLRSGQGTLGKLICSDALYLQLLASLTQFEYVMSDLANYGLFYQFSSGWQRQRRMRSQPCSMDFGVESEIKNIASSLKRVDGALRKMKGKKMREPELEELVKKIQALKDNLSETTKTFVEWNQELASK